MNEATRPNVRPDERTFLLFYIRRKGITPDNPPTQVIGFAVTVRFGRAYCPCYMLCAYTEGWVRRDQSRFDSLHELFLIAELFYRIELDEWIGCHPVRGEPLYSKPRSKVERLHRTVVQQANDFLRYRHGSLADRFRRQAAWAGAHAMVDGTY